MRTAAICFFVFEKERKQFFSSMDLEKQLNQFNQFSFRGTQTMGMDIRKIRSEDNYRNLVLIYK